MFEGQSLTWPLWLSTYLKVTLYLTNTITHVFEGHALPDHDDYRHMRGNTLPYHSNYGHLWGRNFTCPLQLWTYLQAKPYLTNVIIDICEGQALPYHYCNIFEGHLPHHHDHRHICGPNLTCQSHDQLHLRAEPVLSNVIIIISKARALPDHYDYPHFVKTKPYLTITIVDIFEGRALPDNSNSWHTWGPRRTRPMQVLTYFPRPNLTWPLQLSTYLRAKPLLTIIINDTFEGEALPDHHKYRHVWWPNLTNSL